MKEGTLDRPTFETIEAYVLERMPQNERAAFELRLATDADLRAEVDLERENIQAVELGGVMRLLNDVAREERIREQKNHGGLRYLKYAAVLAAVASGIIWWVTRPSLNEALYAEQFVPDPGLPVAMGTTNNIDFADAMVAYKLGHYAEARAKWTALHERMKANDTLDYYLASAWLADGNPKQAIPLLKPLVDRPASAFHHRAQWYLFLAFVHDGRTSEARTLGLEHDATYGERVRAILAQLPG
ncbi:MAG: hypothetical protein JST41_11725 [Bacteroidetes bacterium]|nr:hypothetical protein [Bacteroidota bacterium]HMU14093.1 hypothetical protein [Flavobacteriales bacterium]